MTHQHLDAARRGVRTALASAGQGLRVFLVGAEAERPDPRRAGRVVTRVFAWIGGLYLLFGASTYLAAKSGLPSWVCLVAGFALAAPLVLAVTRPLLAWRVAWVAAILTGAAVQAHHRTPFSWHPAVFLALVLILVVLVRRHPPAVSAWAWASMVVLIEVSFYPADRFGLAVAVTVVAVIADLLRRRRARLRSAPRERPATMDRHSATA